MGVGWGRYLTKHLWTTACKGFRLKNLINCIDTCNYHYFARAVQKQLSQGN